MNRYPLRKNLFKIILEIAGRVLSWDAVGMLSVPADIVCVCTMGKLKVSQNGIVILRNEGK